MKADLRLKGLLVVLGAIGAMAGAWLAGCEGKPKGHTGQPKPAARRGNGAIAFVGAGQRHPLWPVLKASAERYDREMCMLEVQYLCPDGDSPQDQIDLLKSLTDIALRGVCVQLENAPALEPTLRELYNRGILIVSMIKPAPEEIRVGHVGFDESVVGETLADAAAEAIGDQGALMLCSDGLWGVLAEQDIYRAIIEAPSLPRACYNLVEAANMAGGPDNISVVLVQLLG